MAASYPGSLKSFTTKTDKVDLYKASHINDLQNEVVAIETELGTDPAGNQTDVKTRLSKILSDSGALRQGSSFPGTTESGLVFFKTNEDTMYFRNAANSNWLSFGQSLSNVIFHWNGSDLGKLYIGTSVDPVAEGSQRIYASTLNSSYQTFVSGKWTKIAGISTVTIHSRVWGTGPGDLKVDIGGQNNSVTNNSSTPGWATTATINVSSLSNGTTYDITCQIKDSSSGAGSYCSTVILIGS